ncbi:MAG TPA: DUF2911 domain-containing protein [Verrucomicrobiae bacterium]|jgi:hypothetical protein|nr:DUF2911 domain-containing protein [Verrucomicrobiae bacterium]
MNRKILLALAVAGGLAFSSQLFAQSPRVNFPAASPACTVKQRVGLTDITVVYSRPGMKDRTVFGGIVPYDTVWRTGANQATKITFSTPVKLEGNDIPAGTYSLFTIPGKDQWTIIINKDADQFGAFKYKADDDLVRFTVTPRTLTDTTLDAFTIEFNRIRDDSALLMLIWDKTVVPIKLQVDVVSKVVPQIEAAMAAPGKKLDGFYFQAAQFYYDHGQDLNKALEWINAGLADKPMIAFEMLHVKAQILAKQGDKAGAIAAAKESSDLAIKAEGPNNSFVWMNQQLISSLQ